VFVILIEKVTGISLRYE